MKKTLRNAIFHKNELDTQTLYEEDGIVRTWPCSWILENAPIIPIDKGPISISGKLTVDENGTSVFVPYRTTNSPRYMQVYTFGNSTVRLTKRHIIVTFRLERNGNEKHEIQEYNDAQKKIMHFMQKQLNIIFNK